AAPGQAAWPRPEAPSRRSRQAYRRACPVGWCQPRAGPPQRRRCLRDLPRESSGCVSCIPHDSTVDVAGKFGLPSAVRRHGPLATEAPTSGQVKGRRWTTNRKMRGPRAMLGALEKRAAELASYHLKFTPILAIMTVVWMDSV